MRWADREDHLGFVDERSERAHVPQSCRARPGLVAPPLRCPEHVVAALAQRVADRGTHLTRVQEPDDHSTSASTKAKNATEMTPFIVKNAASRRRRSPGRTSVCSYRRSAPTIST